MALDMLGRRYGKAPHELVALSDVELAFDWAVMEKAKAAEKAAL